MNLKLHRSLFLHDGIFGELTNEQNVKVASTLEHAYDSGNGDGSFKPKLQNGTFTCVKGQHRLEHMKAPFTTFEITGVTGHTNILFHTGNYNEDSNGCVLLGENVQSVGKMHMVVFSKITFTKFMDSLKDVDRFTLTVT